MKARRHHNNKGIRQIARGKCARQLEQISKRMGVVFVASNFKHKPARSKKYMEWVTTLPCCLTGHRANDYLGVDPHHEPELGHGTMGGKPCDSRCVPIRHDLHVLMETPGNSRLSVWARYNKQPEAEIERTRNIWIDLGGKKFW